eukprot:PLAT9420.1.p1 GENE.PLAT9420.1~~PLAT9420.1.p1  ORF type:complete len:829 (+),score=351.69 PLAT9420.1:62-2488(+)
MAGKPPRSGETRTGGLLSRLLPFLPGGDADAASAISGGSILAVSLQRGARMRLVGGDSSAGDAAGGNCCMYALMGGSAGFAVWALPSDGCAAPLPLLLTAQPVGYVTVMSLLPQARVRPACRPTALLAGSPLLALARNHAEVSDDDDWPPSLLRIWSLRSSAFVHDLQFDSAVLAVQATDALVVVVLRDRLLAFHADDFEPAWDLPTARQADGAAAVALSARWVAYPAPTPAKPASRRHHRRGSSADAFYAEDLSMSAELGDGDGAAGDDSGETGGGGGASSGAAAGASGLHHLARDLTTGLYAVVGMSKRVIGSYLADGSSADGSSGVRARSSSGDGSSRDGDSDGGAAGGGSEADNGSIIVRDIHSRKVLLHFTAHAGCPIGCMAFDGSGTLLATAAPAGQVVHVFRLRPQRGELDDGGVRHMYTLSRGFTHSLIRELRFSPNTLWLAATSAHGTTHVFPVRPRGGAVSPATHAHSGGASLLARLPRRVEPLELPALSRLKQSSLIKWLTDGSAYLCSAAWTPAGQLCVCGESGAATVHALLATAAPPPLPAGHCGVALQLVARAAYACVVTAAALPTATAVEPLPPVDSVAHAGDGVASLSGSGSGSGSGSEDATMHALSFVETETHGGRPPLWGMSTVTCLRFRHDQTSAAVNPLFLDELPMEKLLPASRGPLPLDGGRDAMAFLDSGVSATSVARSPPQLGSAELEAMLARAITDPLPSGAGGGHGDDVMFDGEEEEDRHADGRHDEDDDDDDVDEGAFAWDDGDALATSAAAEDGTVFASSDGSGEVTVVTEFYALPKTKED